MSIGGRCRFLRKNDKFEGIPEACEELKRRKPERQMVVFLMEKFEHGIANTWVGTGRFAHRGVSMGGGDDYL